LSCENPDEVVSSIRSGKTDVYKALDNFVAFLMKEGFAPRTVWNYLSAARGFLRYEDVQVDQYKLRDKITLPPKMEVSVDRIPTSEELKKLLLEADLRLKAAVAILASSGMRIGELCNLRVCNIDFDKGH
jgi:integrase